MRVKRVREQVEGLGDIHLADTVAINTRTNMRYPAREFRTPYGNALSLYNLRPDESVDVNVDIRVPNRLERIDLEVPQTVPFRGVPISTPTTTTALR
jgi:hypothetical protein